MEQIKRVDNSFEKEDGLLNSLLRHESFAADSQGQKEIENHFNQQAYLTEHLNRFKQKMDSKIFSRISLALKILLISKIIGGANVEAQTHDIFKDEIESFKEHKDSKGIDERTFIMNCDEVDTPEENSDREQIKNYLKNLGMDNVNFHTENSKLFGQYAEVHKKYREFANDNPAFLRFGSSLYSGQSSLDSKVRTSSIATNSMIPVKDSIAANKISQELYIDFCEKHTVDPAKQIYFDNSSGGNLMLDELGDIKFAFVNVGSNMISNNYYTPAYVVAIHELNHLQRLGEGQGGLRKVGDRITEALDEIPTRINEAINNDYIFKKINGIALEEEVAYEERLDCDYSESLSIGLVANTFRSLLKKYETIEDCLMSPEGQSFVKQYFKDRR